MCRDSDSRDSAVLVATVPDMFSLSQDGRRNRWAAGSYVRPNGLLGDAEQREVQLVGADVLTLRHAGEPLLRHYPVSVGVQTQGAPGLSVPVAALGICGHVAGAWRLFQQVVDLRRLTA